MKKKRWENRLTDQLFDSIVSLKSRDEARRFFRDLLTVSEIDEFSRRLEVAKRLNDGESYVSIEVDTNMSSTTIARISKFLKGKNKGYKDVLEKLVKDNHHAPV